MASYIDPAIEQEIEHFRRRLEEAGNHHRQAMGYILVDRLMRDAKALRQSQKPPKPLLRSAADIGKKAGRWVVRRLSLKRFADLNLENQGEPTIIEGSYRIINDQVEGKTPLEDLARGEWTSTSHTTYD